MSKAKFSKFTHVLDDTDLSGSMIIYFDKLEMQMLEKPRIVNHEDWASFTTPTCIHMNKKNARKLYEELKGYLGD